MLCSLDHVSRLLMLAKVECVHQRRSPARWTIPCVSTAGSVLLLCFGVETSVQIPALCQGGNCQGAMCLVGHHRNALCLVGWLARPSVGCVCVLCLCRRVDVVMLRMPKMKASTAAASTCHESAVLDEAKIRLLPVRAAG